ncbi:acyl-CoA dehydrogenase family protein [Halocella sp. SP3-1]|uniref:acyl-CoA dehydrogenase family protein n=1 Tax=Halocella sp. SP3-1 TaxID=2382161 RepID=UPI000F754250|nr:acyl-CoA dehydrogenase family protein [Halocella sp. SP3-1]AZO93842.1 acyl-CoA dehydrogenase [Halocella sp. SP3-1]
MDYFLTEKQKIICNLARRIAEEKIVPVAAKYDESGEFPWEIMKIIAQTDMFRVFIPGKYGGLDGGVLEMALVTEELSKICGGIALGYAATGLGSMPILLFGNEEQKEKYLPQVADGTIAAFALTESEAGSDASNMQTTAAKDGDFYILNGTKQWITNGGEADLYTVIAMTNKSKGSRGATAFIVEKGTPGFSFGVKEDKMGIRGSTTRELIFNNCRIHKSQILGRIGMGYIVALKTLDRTRPGVAAQAVGIAQGAINVCLKYTKEREQFGQTIASFQATRHMLADMAMQTEAARSLVYSTARMIDSGATKIGRESAMCKCFASDVAMKVTTDAVQIFGGYGYMKDYPVEKMMRDAKITQIYEGTNQIQRNVIAATLWN